MRALLIFTVAVLAYAGTVPSGFVFDDRAVISQSPVVQGTVPLKELPFRDWLGELPAHTMGCYRPIPVLAFWVDWRVSHHSEHYFHFLNVLLHGVAMTVAFLVFRGIVGENIAFAGALLAAVLAASSEAVEGAVGRADLLETIAIVAGLAAHRRAGWRWGALASLALAMALGSKESGVLAVVAWGALDLLAPAKAPARKRLSRWGGYAAVIAVYLVMRRAALGSLELPRNGSFFVPLASAGVVGRVFGAAHIFVERYLLGILDPRRRLYDCSANACLPSGPGDPVAWLGLVLVVGLVAGPFLLRRRVPAAATGLTWFACFFLPVSNLIVPASLTYGERLLYLPSLGLCLSAACLAEALARRISSPVLVWSGFGVIAAVNAVSLQWHHLDWRTPVALYRSGLRYGSDSALVLENAAAAANFEGRFREAEQLARRSIAEVPSQPMALVELATSLDRQGRAGEAEGAFREALRTNLRVEVVGEYVAFLMGHQRLSEARATLAQFRQSWPDAPRLLMLQDQLEELQRAGSEVE